jgi:deazaflavin-dependent oxidoreductase (nitroreductase family)
MRSKNLKKPRGLSRAFYRAPILLYKIGLGSLMGERFLLLSHAGRKTGEPRQTVIEIVEKDESIDTYYVVAAWGEKADWLQNLRKEPRCSVRVGNRRFDAEAKFVSRDQAEATLMDYARRHPKALRSLAAFTGFEVDGSDDDYRKMARQLPTVALTPLS